MKPNMSVFTKQERPFLGSAVKDGKLRFTSVSQIIQFDHSTEGCNRRWFYSYVRGLKEEKTAKQRKRRAAAKAEKAKPARAARAPKAAKVPREKRAKDPIAGIRSEVKLKKLQVNTGAALSVIYRGVAGLRPSLDGVDAVAADRLIAQLRARGVEG